VPRNVSSLDELRPGTRGPAQPIQAVDRAMALLRSIALSVEAPSLPEVADACGLNRSTAWRLLATLEKHAMVERNPDTNRYSVGYGAMQVGAAADSASLVRRVRPALRELASATGERVSIAVVSGVNLIYADQLDPPDAPPERWVGRPLSLHASSTGKIFLAHLPLEERAGALPAELPRYTPTTITDLDQLEQELDAAREHGYATSIGEDVAYSNGVSAAVLDPRGRPIVVVNAWGIEQRVPITRFPALGEAVSATAARMAELLEGTPG
jgi:DNA-binding IclR family transcriptional regulator